MVNISNKEIVHREAEAIGMIRLKRETIKAIREGDVKKGDTLSVAEIACIQAVKKTPELLPFCHPIPVTSVNAEFKVCEDYIEAKCRVTADYKTGVEMEAIMGTEVGLVEIRR